MINSPTNELDDFFYRASDQFFQENNIGLSYDDVLIVPQESDVGPRQTDPTSKLTKNLTLGVPIIASPMDTISEGDMGIAMARSGALAIIHCGKNTISADRQAQEVARVRNHRHGVISTPVTVKVGQSIGDILSMKREQGISFSTFPVVNDSGVLVGLLESSAVKEIHASKMVQDVMKSGEAMVRLTEHEIKGDPIEVANKIFENRVSITKLPLVDKTGKLTGLIDESDVFRINKEANNNTKITKDSDHRLKVGAGVPLEFKDGILDRDTMGKRIHQLLDAGANILTISTAHAHSKNVCDAVEFLRSEAPQEVDIIAGNVVTAEGVNALADKGADAVTIGIGGGSICTTRIKTGIGVPQLTAIHNCGKAAEKRGIGAIADGSASVSADIAKAMTQTDAAMLGSFVAGTDETPGDVFISNGKKYKTYRGMGSKGAMERGAARYGDTEDSASQNTNIKLAAEGIEGAVPYKGPVEDIVREIEQCFRATMGYVGAADIKTFKKKAKFIRITPSAQVESGVHDVINLEE